MSYRGRNNYRGRGGSFSGRFPRNSNNYHGYRNNNWIFRANHYLLSSWRSTQMDSYDFIDFVIHCKPAKAEMQANDCWDIIENNTQIPDYLIHKSQQPTLNPNIDQIWIDDPILAKNLTNHYHSLYERWLKEITMIDTMIDKHNKKLKNVYIIMCKYFSPAVLQRVNNLLEQKTLL